MSTYICTCIYTYICVCVNICVCIYVYVYILNNYCGLDKNNHDRPTVSGILGDVDLLEDMWIEASVSLGGGL